MPQVSLIAPQLSGAASVTAEVDTDPQGVITFTTDLTAPEASAMISGTATPAEPGFAIIANQHRRFE